MPDEKQLPRIKQYAFCHNCKKMTLQSRSDSGEPYNCEVCKKNIGEKETEK